jgi:hypothetical protein
MERPQQEQLVDPFCVHALYRIGHLRHGNPSATDMPSESHRAYPPKTLPSYGKWQVKMRAARCGLPPPAPIS